MLESPQRRGEHRPGISVPTHHDRGALHQANHRGTPPSPAVIDHHHRRMLGEALPVSTIMSSASSSSSTGVVRPTTKIMAIGTRHSSPPPSQQQRHQQIQHQPHLQSATKVRQSIRRRCLSLMGCHDHDSTPTVIATCTGPKSASSLPLSILRLLGVVTFLQCLLLGWTFHSVVVVHSSTSSSAEGMISTSTATHHPTRTDTHRQMSFQSGMGGSSFSFHTDQSDAARSIPTMLNKPPEENGKSENQDDKRSSSSYTKNIKPRLDEPISYRLHVTPSVPLAEDGSVGASKDPSWKRRLLESVPSMRGIQTYVPVVHVASLTTSEDDTITKNNSGQVLHDPTQQRTCLTFTAVPQEIAALAALTKWLVWKDPYYVEHLDCIHVTIPFHVGRKVMKRPAAAATSRLLRQRSRKTALQLLQDIIAMQYNLTSPEALVPTLANESNTLVQQDSMDLNRRMATSNLVTNSTAAASGKNITGFDSILRNEIVDEDDYYNHETLLRLFGHPRVILHRLPADYGPMSRYVGPLTYEQHPHTSLIVLDVDSQRCVPAFPSPVVALSGAKASHGGRDGRILERPSSSSAGGTTLVPPDLLDRALAKASPETILRYLHPAEQNLIHLVQASRSLDSDAVWCWQGENFEYDAASNLIGPAWNTFQSQSTQIPAQLNALYPFVSNTTMGTTAHTNTTPTGLPQQLIPGDGSFWSNIIQKLVSPSSSSSSSQTAFYSWNQAHFCRGVGGLLFHPVLFRRFSYNQTAYHDSCYWDDDRWVSFQMERAGIPCKVLHVVGGDGESSRNRTENGGDTESTASLEANKNRIPELLSPSTQQNETAFAHATIGAVIIARNSHLTAEHESHKLRYRSHRRYHRRLGTLTSVNMRLHSDQTCTLAWLHHHPDTYRTAKVPDWTLYNRRRIQPKPKKVH